MSLRVKEPATRVLFLRHGQTDYPEDRIYDEDQGPPLNAAGEREARALARWIQGLEVAVVVASPALRTRQTATPVAAALGLSLELEPALLERRFGIWEGLTFQEIEARYPRELQAWKQDPVGYAPPGGETIGDLHRRVMAWLQKIRATYPGKTIVAVAHQGPIRVAVADALEMPLRRYRNLSVPPGSATRIDYGTTTANLVYLGVLPEGKPP